ncbi:carbohydrate ABC transporter permease [Alicyclobacillus tolerans]|uniref:carbohydrate ABC transporter permease n=1 Tax=Alicyclobacillus tolerans TaxID=90970 RepID=UPI001F3B9943|nr:carbohydrate ABC transporter permease [Alicyclobacillus tolerans]MCF8566686.1 carbohydrate ABC transporter permease [Alicyclobacillus tolerans]
MVSITKMPMAKRKKHNRPVILILAYILFVVLVFPYLVMLLTSLKTNTTVYAIPPTFFPKPWDFHNYVEIFQKAPVLRYVLNTVFVAGGATVLALLCGIPAAYVVARAQFRGKKAYLYLLLITQMFSPIVLLVGLFKEVLFLGLMNNLWALVLINAAFNQAFTIWLLSGYFSSLPHEIEQAAWIDGCTRFQALRRITLPLAMPGIVTTVIFVFIAAWNEFAVALTIMSSDHLKPLTVGIYTFIGQYNIQWQYLFATSLIATVPVVILFLLIEKYLIGGLTGGGVKH